MSTPYEITGTIKVINDTQTFPSGFSKRVFVVTTKEDKYPQDIPLEAVKEGCDRLDAYNVGDDITVSFNIRGNEYNGKYYVQLQAWKFDRKAGERAPQGARSSEYGQREAPRNSGPGMPPAPAPMDYDTDDDIPF